MLIEDIDIVWNFIYLSFLLLCLVQCWSGNVNCDMDMDREPVTNCYEILVFVTLAGADVTYRRVVQSYAQTVCSRMVGYSRE